eukprot:g10644.t1
MATAPSAGLGLGSRAFADARRRSRFLNFEDAKAYIRERGLEFRSILEYRSWSLAGKRPLQLPADPATVYKGRGWKGYPDFLGYEVSKYDPTRKSAEKLLAELPKTANREAMGRRSAAQTRFADVVKKFVPEYEGRLLSARCPSLFAFRKRASNDANAASFDRWIVVQLKFARAESERTEDFPNKMVFRDVVRDADVGVIFLSDEITHIAFKTSADFHRSVGAGRRSDRVPVAMLPFDSALLTDMLDAWWETAAKDSFLVWAQRFGSTSPGLVDHELVVNKVAARLYEPAGLAIEKIFPLDTCMQGNILLSGVRCMQRISRPYASMVLHSGYFFDINKFWNKKSRVRGRGWQGSVERYICIIVEPGSGREDVRIRGAFVFPHAIVFRGNRKEGISHRGRLLVYPPHVTAGNALSRLKQREQLPFFINFETTTKEEQVRKVKELLGV